MIRSLLFIVFACVVQIANAQTKPVFKSKSDSIEYATLQQKMALASSTRSLTAEDSLVKAYNVLRQRITWQIVYRPNNEFTRYTDLLSGTVHPDSVLKLSIADVKAAEIPEAVFACKNLQALELVNTRIDKIQTELSQLTKLKELYLFNNIPASTLLLENNPNISYVRIAGYNPEKMPKSYAGLSGLDSLNLNRSMISKLPSIKKNKELLMLTAVENNIRSVKRVKKSSSLEKLDLRLNKVTVVPNSLSRKFKSLKQLSFNTNPIKKVKPGLAKFKQLEYLSFYGNKLPEIPKPVYKLATLKVIDLFDNRIEAISPDIKNMQGLEVLYLANNRLYSLPEEIGTLKNLRELYIYNNRMDTLPASMDNLENLKVLWINDNYFHSIPAATWRAKSIHDIDASQNYIKHIPHELAAAKLSVLILSGSLFAKEKDSPEVFEKLRQQGTKIIYYNTDGF
jgi:Leucine-rich repeat (LRR) protein